MSDVHSRASLKSGPKLPSSRLPFHLVLHLEQLHLFIFLSLTSISPPSHTQISNPTQSNNTSIFDPSQLARFHPIYFLRTSHRRVYTHTYVSRGNKKGLPPPSKSHWHPVPANASSPYSNFVSLPTNQRPIHREKPPPATASVLPLLRLALVLSPPTNPSIKMTRSHKYGERDHKGLADGSVSPTEQLPRFFAKSGYVDVDPKKVKKDGNGKGNWGSVGEEVIDQNFRFTNARRRSNSFSHHNLSDFKTKFEVNEMDPLYDESLHGPIDEENGDDLSKTDSTESVHSV
ncbi:hypothetical protein TGAM01_v201072 [Trichoderma gamsii]|uniref:Hyaluronan/mRNA-binding protein domain-containing protein n=1 Tax=Trichoderma gamsii TaxID=398673 RepID=A0A2P4ZZK1_9HYPO|nr:hypothetical protein TGAM01_v201072 [Trichoderma gamsii]PON29706.1 hypothetical protein TGAM01_v201072 [Trichoderma gamsii]